MSTNPIFYTVIDGEGNITASQVTQDPNFPVQEGYRVVKDQVPNYDGNRESIVRITPVPSTSNEVQYEIIDFSSEVIAEITILERNSMLDSSDWTQLPDVPLSSEQLNLWRVYRQELRDVPQQTGFPDTVVWPVKPE